MKKGALALIWIYRIVLSPVHIKTSFFKRIYYNINGGFIADQIGLYNLNRKNKHEYLSEFDWYKSRYINGNYKFILNNKIVCTQLLKQYIYVPQIFAIKQTKRICGFDNSIDSAEKIINLIKKEKKVFIKPIDSGKGKGVQTIRFDKNKFFIDNDEISSSDLNKYLLKEKNYFICESIVQNEYLNKLYDKTTNTLRLITFKDPETDKFILDFAVQRIGRKQTIPVDNGSMGGLVAKVDLDTGMLSSARCLHNLNEYKKHPDSNSKIEGAIIPEWDKIKEEIIELSNHFPYLNFIAWDVLLTKKGMCIIEANTSSGVNILQLWGGQRNQKLGDFYRYHSVIKK